jgi:hypothetical protein
MTVTHERTLLSVGEWPLYNRYKFVTVSLPKRFRNDRFTSETAARRFQKRNYHLDSEVAKKIRWDFQKALDIIAFQGGDNGRGYRNMCKTPRGSDLKEGD